MRAFLLPLTIAGALVAGVLAEGCLGRAEAFGTTEIYNAQVLCCCELVAGGTCCVWQTTCGARNLPGCGPCQ